MRYEVLLLQSAEKELDRLPSAIYNRVRDKVISLEGNPRPRGLKKLSGREEYRLRVGDYRILYVVDDNNHIVTIVSVGHRREVYG